MKIGILSKRTQMITGKIKDYLEKKGHNVKIYSAENLCINESLFENDFYILKSKKLFYLYAGYFLEANNIPVIPTAEISHKHKYRIDAHFLIKEANLLAPKYYMGTQDTIKKNLKDEDYPLIVKPLMGSGSKGVKVIKSVNDLNFKDDQIIFLEEFIEGSHYNVYFIDKQICTLEKPPLTHEHVKMKLVPTPNDIREIILKWKKTHNLLFGHLDIVRENETDKIFIVDPGSFPEFTNWKCEGDPVQQICNLILKKAKRIMSN